MLFGVLGPLQVIAGESDEPATLSAPRLRTMLATLLSRANQPVPTDELAELVWDGAPPSGARDATRALVMRLRRQLDDRAAARIVTRPPGYVIEISSAELDASRFEALTHEAGAAVLARQWAKAAQVTARALELWRGPPLTDIPSQLLRDGWVPRLENLLVQALEWHAEAGLHESQPEELIGELTDLTARYPLRERFHGQLMLALYRCGRQAEALAAYQRARYLLVTELGVEPGHELANLHQQILSSDPLLEAVADPAPTAAAGPAPTAAAGPAPGPAPVPAPAPASAVELRFSLPPDSAAFTGRDAQLNHITATVRDRARAGKVVIIHAIDGMPGVGKTALAVHAAHLLRGDFPDRCLFIDLHAHTPGHEPVPPESALAGLLAAAGVEARNLPGDLESRAAMWRNTMAGQRALLVADLVAETRASLLSLAAEDDTVAAAFELSYQHLDPAQQRFFALLGLHPGTMTDPFAAAALTATTFADAVRRLDGLHQEGLLTETGYRRYGLHDLLRRYARDRATALPAPTSKPAVERLLDYYQHTATLAQDLLANQTRPFPAAVTPPPSAAPALQTAGQALTWVRAERDNLLACLDHNTHAGQDARVVALTAALAELLRRDGPWAEATARHTAALHSARRLSDQAGQANALTGLGAVRRLTGDYQGAITDLEQTLAIYRHLGNPLGEANALAGLGPVRRMMGDQQRAAADLEHALAIYRRLDNALGQANAFTELGCVRREEGDGRGAARGLEQALAIYRDLGNPLGQANALLCLGIMRRATGDGEGAARDLALAPAIKRDLGDGRGEAELLNEIGTLHRLRRDLTGARSHHQRALDLARTHEGSLEVACALAGLGRCALAAADPATARANLTQAAEIFRRIGAPEATLVATELAALTAAGHDKPPEPGAALLTTMLTSYSRSP